MPERLKLCAWITRHPPTRAQFQALHHAGYKIVYYPLRQYRRAEEILGAIRFKLQAEPDLIVAAMPKNVLHFLAQASPCPVIIARMNHNFNPPRWTGHWRKVVRVKLETIPFRL